jgi:general secretion pathway protein D
MTIAAHLRSLELAVRRGLATFIAGSMIATSATPAFAQEGETPEPDPVPAVTPRNRAGKAPEGAFKAVPTTTREEFQRRREERQRAAKENAARKKAARDGEEVVAAPEAEPRAEDQPVEIDPDVEQVPAIRKRPGAAPAQGPAAPPTPRLPTAGTAPAAPVSGAPDALPGALKPFETGLDYKPTSPSTKVTFNLEDADLPDLVRLISQITGKRFILPSKGRSIKATVYAPTKVTAAEAYQAFLSILELNGMALVPSGRYLKIVESGRVEGRAIPLYTEDEDVPGGDRFLTHLHRVNNISAEDAATLLERFKSGDGSITGYAPTNMLIITDTGTNIQRMMRILTVIDVARTGEQMWVEPVHHADATELASRLTEIFEPAASASSSARKAAAPAKGKTPAAAAAGPQTVGARGAESRLTKILADERTNSLIILATERMYLRILEMLKYLDVSIEGEGRIHVHHLQHSDAEEMASTIQSLTGGRGGGGGQAGGKAGAAAAGSGDGIFEGTVAITAHKATNALVITSSAHDYAALRHVIDKLDNERKQVFIEAVIMELSVDRSNSFGISYHGGIPNVPVDGSVSVLGFQASKTIGGLAGMAANGEVLSGLAVGVQGPVISNSQQLVGLSLPGFGVAVNALASSGDANILSTPHLIATDNIEAEISVGQNVPLQTGAGIGGGLGNLSSLAGLAGGQSGGNAGALSALAGLSGGGFGGSVPRQDVGTTVTITPHINASSEIRLEINQEISSAGAPSEQGDLGVVSIDKTNAKTEVVVRDQQTVVIGGLMRDQLTNSATKVPVLGDIPLIGALFRSTSKRKIKKNLLLFLTPYIIRSPADLRFIYERKMRERQEFLDRYFVFGDSEYQAPVDYSRTRGLIGEIINELGMIDEHNKLLADAAMRPELKHDPRPPVGQAPEGSMNQSPEEGDMVIEPEDGAPPPPPDDAPPPPEPAPAPEQPVPGPE